MYPLEVAIVAPGGQNVQILPPKTSMKRKPTTGAALAPGGQMLQFFPPRPTMLRKPTTSAPGGVCTASGGYFSRQNPPLPEESLENSKNLSPDSLIGSEAHGSKISGNCTFLSSDVQDSLQ